MNRDSSKVSFIRGLALAAFTIIVWGVTFINTKALLGSFSALEIQVLRFAVGYATLWVMVPRRVRVAKGDHVLFACLGWTGVAVYQLMENCAIHYTNASNVAILVSLCPVVTAILVRIFRGKPELSFRFMCGFLVAITGVVLVSLNGVWAFHFRPQGDLIAVVAMLSWGVYSLLVSKTTEHRYEQIVVVRSMFFWALVFTFPLVVFGMTSYGRSVMDGSFSITLDWAENVKRFSNFLNWMNLGFLGILASALCFVFWNRACSILGVVRCTVGLYLIPVLTVVFAYFFLGETLTLLSAAGAVLTLIGVFVSTR